MIFSLALIFLLGMALGRLFGMIGIPRLLGMLVTGIILGPYALDLLDPTLLQISSELRQIALIIILTRAGLNLDIKDLKQVGRPAFLLCFVPACFEIAGTVLLAPRLFDISLLDAAIMGTVIAAVSPAVVVPKMLQLMEKGYGGDKKIPQMVMAGASVDDVFVIVLFTAFTGLATQGNIDATHFLTIPSSIIFGVLGGIAAGLMLSLIFTRFHIRDSAKVIMILSFSFLLVTLERQAKGVIGFSGLLAVMALGMTIAKKKYPLSERLSSKLSKLWVAAEVLLFVLVGASVNISYAWKAGTTAVLLLMAVLLFRILGVFLSLSNTRLNKKERIFTALSYIPKATVQAAIGGLPLAMGIGSGELILTVAVLSILITAPIGAAFIDLSYKKLLAHEAEN
ncbi:MAG: cation:proton antiporter [Clostridiales bacterium]|jgi:NhaP-type Na+/H+ or K+/H+ antiporter|nr:cation:proton antiporter [Clostridiales bacterium]MDD4186932.1 cation:proton antiporter [Eubacteriales bacterium]